MTQLEFKDIQTRLSVWKAERHLTTNQQRDGLVSNLLEELTEYSRANSVEEQVDSHCDMLVFIINAFDDIKNYEKTMNAEEYEESKSAQWLTIDLLNNLTESKVHFCVKLLCEQIRYFGYNPYKCMLETIKEISSRTGYFDETINKFVKDKSPKAQAKWYKANYSLCKEMKDEQ